MLNGQLPPFLIERPAIFIEERANFDERRANFSEQGFVLTHLFNNKVTHKYSFIQ